jgi:hypothetical protein
LDFGFDAPEPPTLPTAEEAAAQAPPAPDLGKLAEALSTLTQKVEALSVSPPPAPAPPPVQQGFSPEALVAALRQARADEQQQAAWAAQMAPPELPDEDELIGNGAALKGALQRTAAWAAGMGRNQALQAMAPLAQQVQAMAQMAPVLLHSAASSTKAAVTKQLTGQGVTPEEVDDLWGETVGVVAQTQVPWEQKVQMAQNPTTMAQAVLALRHQKTASRPTPPPSIGTGQVAMGGSVPGAPQTPASAIARQAESFWGVKFSPEQLTKIADAGRRVQ